MSNGIPYATLRDIANELKNIREILEKQSTTEQSSEVGEWIKEYNGNGWNDYWDYTCPVCGKKYERGDNVLYDSFFCPNCGSRMRG